MTDHETRAVHRGTELVFGLVSPLGTPLDPVEDALRDSLSKHGYTTSPAVRISRLLAQRGNVTGRPEATREALMDEGTRLREAGGGDYLAKLAVATIHTWRTSRGHAEPATRTGHIIRSLKHPDEVARLRAVYGNGFFLIGVSAPRWQRLARLVDANFPKDVAERLLDKDSGEQRDLGQQTRDTFHHADVYVRSDANTKADIDRFIDLVMSHPFLPPTQEEHAMYLAYAASLRSADLSRQVGAVVLDARGDVIATGANDVPSAGGGPHWPKRPDFWPSVREDGGPDYERGCDSNERERDRILSRVIRALTHTSEESDHELVAKHRKDLEHTGILDLTEFGRAVHAEMAALLACARAGVSPAGGTLFCTTFPCHNCTKHIVDAGVSRVVYVEPYPKSKAGDLHDDAVVLVDERSDRLDDEDPRVRFEIFVGVGARRFVDLFSLTLGSGRKVRRKQKAMSGVRLDWLPGRDSEPRLPLDPRSYVEREEAMSGVLDIDPEHGRVANGEPTDPAPTEDVT